MQNADHSVIEIALIGALRRQAVPAATQRTLESGGDEWSVAGSLPGHLNSRWISLFDFHQDGLYIIESFVRVRDRRPY
jgi:hypothetical protein